jgi:Prokaryotic cytochrome b561
MVAVLTSDLPAAERWYRRHSALLRITHWINVVCFTLLLLSGLQIFNAHPALYVGDMSDFDHPAVSIAARQSESGLVGETTILGHSFDTTGVLGLSNEDGQISQRAFRAGLRSRATWISRLGGAGISFSPGYWC